MDEFGELEEYIEWACAYTEGVLAQRTRDVEQDLEVEISAQLLRGKRFRPTLTLLCCQALGGDVEEALRFAPPIEFMHEGSLAHDDVFDRAGTRRGIMSLPEKLGVGEAVEVGDALFGYALGDLGLLSPVAVGRAAETVCSLVRGALKELKLKNVFQEPPLLEVMYAKTASLYALACSCGAVAADAEKEWVDVMNQYGLNLGMSFQMVDDLADLYESLLKSEPVGDMKTRRITYPLTCMWMSGPRLRQVAEKWVAGELGLEDIATVLAEDSSGLVRAKRQIEHFEARALAAIDHLPDSKFKTFLMVIPKYMEMRMMEEVGALEEYKKLSDR